MTVQLDRIPPTRQEVRERNSVLTYSGRDLMRDVRQAVKRESERYRISTHERDALSGAVALSALERPAILNERPDSPEFERDRQRVAALRLLVREHMRDSRAWRDTVDGWRPRDQSERGSKRDRSTARAPRAALPLTITEQAERYRTWEREHDSRPALTSTDALTERWTHEDAGTTSGTDYLSLAWNEDEEARAGEGLPAPALTEHSRVLAQATARTLFRRWTRERGDENVRDEDRTTPLKPLTERALEIALLVKSGDSCEEAAITLGVSRPTAARDSALGCAYLREMGPEWVRDARRDASDEHGLTPEHDEDGLPASAAHALVWVRAAQRQAGRDARVHAAGGGGTTSASTEPRHGTARDVLRYVAAITRVLEHPAWTFSTDGAREHDRSAHVHGWRHPRSPLVAPQPVPPRPLPRGSRALVAGARARQELRSWLNGGHRPEDWTHSPEREFPPTRTEDEDGRVTWTHVPLTSILCATDRGLLFWGLTEDTSTEDEPDED